MVRKHMTPVVLISIRVVGIQASSVLVPNTCMEGASTV